MAVTEVELSRAGQNPLDHSMARGQDKIVRGKIQGLDGGGHEGKKVPVDLFHTGDPSQEGLPCRILRKAPPLLPGKTVEENEEVGIGKETHNLCQDPLGPRPDGEPLVDDRNLHALIFLFKRA